MPMKGINASFSQVMLSTKNLSLASLAGKLPGTKKLQYAYAYSTLRFMGQDRCLHET